MMLDKLFSEYHLNLSEWIENGVDFIVAHGRGVMIEIRWPVDQLLGFISHMLKDAPKEVLLVAVLLWAWRSAGLRIGIFSSLSLLLIGFLGLWEHTMITVAMVLTAVILCVLFGIPLGIIAGMNRACYRALRPVLDVMQTTPTFVYLVPIVMLFGIGDVPGVIATTIFAMPPVVRLTALGIQEVQPEVVEAGESFGPSRLQLLKEVQFPLAMPSIVLGINQTIMMALSMVVVASLIGARGLGFDVLSGINELKVGLAATSGLCIVLLAMILDRITQGMLTRKQDRNSWISGVRRCLAYFGVGGAKGSEVRGDGTTRKAR